MYLSCQKASWQERKVYTISRRGSPPVIQSYYSHRCAPRGSSGQWYPPGHHCWAFNLSSTGTVNPEVVLSKGNRDWRPWFLTKSSGWIAFSISSLLRQFPCEWDYANDKSTIESASSVVYFESPQLVSFQSFQQLYQQEQTEQRGKHGRNRQRNFLLIRSRMLPDGSWFRIVVSF